MRELQELARRAHNGDRTAQWLLREGSPDCLQESNWWEARRHGRQQMRQGHLPPPRPRPAGPPIGRPPTPPPRPQTDALTEISRPLQAAASQAADTTSSRGGHRGLGEAADVDMHSGDQSAPADTVNAASETLPSTPMPGLQSAAAGRAGAEHSEGAALPAAAVQGLQRCAGLNRLSLQPPPVSRPLTLHEAMAATQSPAASRRPADQVTERPPQRPLTGVDLATQPEPRPPTAAAAAEAESAMEGVHPPPAQAGTDMEGVQRPPVEAGTVAVPLPPQRPLPQPTPSPLATTSPPPPGAEDAAEDGPRQSE